MRRVLTSLFLAVALIHAVQIRANAYALQFRDTSNSVQIKWPSSTIAVAFSSSLSNPPVNVKPGSDVTGALRRALAHWSEAANIQFVETASNALSISPAGTSGDHTSLITIAHTPDNIAPFAGAAAEMAGRTRVFFTETGSITEADIVLNPRQQFSSDGTPGTFDLEATFTHEIGHLLGLEHSGATASTMQPRQGKNGIYTVAASSQRTLADDDRAGARAIYGLRPGTDARGAIAGSVTTTTGAPVFGANVWAEEATTGRVIASNITLINGAYRIEGLLPGNYRVMVEPLDGPVFASEIASQNGAYAGLADSPPTAFRTVEIGQVGVAAGQATALNAQLLVDEPATFNASLVGLNGHLSTISAPVAAGRTYTVYVGGDRINLKEIPEGGIASTSPFIAVNQASVVEQELDGSLSVISFDVVVNPGAPAGDYSLRLQATTGEVSYVAGALTVDGASAPRAETEQPFVAPAAVPGVVGNALAAGSLAVVSGAALSEEDSSAEDMDEERAGVQLPLELGATTVNLTLSNGMIVSAPLTFVKPTRVGFQIPEEASAGTALVEVMNRGEVAARTSVEITRAQPALFTRNGSGEGPALAFDEETMLPGPFSFETNDATRLDPRTRVVMFGTGLRNASQLTAELGGLACEVESVSPVEEFPGLDRVVVVLPTDAALAGTRDFRLIADGKESNKTELAITP